MPTPLSPPPLELVLQRLHDSEIRYGISWVLASPRRTRRFTRQSFTGGGRASAACTR